MADLRFTAPLWRHAGDAGWHFVTLPHDVADEIADLADREAGARRGFGAVRVEVTCGATTWRTSLFADTSSRSYLLPVKQAVRRAEGVDDGDELTIRLQVVAG